MKITLVILLIVIILLIVLIVFFHNAIAERIIFQPPKKSYDDLDFQLLDVKDKEKVAFRYIPSNDPESLVILFSHGNADNLGTITWRYEQFVAHNFGFASYDYPGYGKSSGKPNAQGVEKYIERVWEELTQKYKIPPKKIVLYGYSLGSGASCYLASKLKNFHSLVLEAPFKSTYSVVHLDFIPNERFPNLERIKKIDQPTLIIHGTRDFVIPYNHGKKLYEASNAAKKELLTIEKAGHLSIISKGQEKYWQKLEKFLKN